MCRAYLWTGEFYSGKAGYVARENVCTPNQAGGLGIKKIHEWNIAAFGKYVWAIGVKKDNLWIKWINEVYIKNSN